MNIWLATGIVIFVGIASYNNGFNSGFRSAPEAVAFDREKLDLEAKTETEVARIAASRPIDGGECLEKVVSSDFDLFDYCKQLVTDSMMRDDEEQHRIGEELQPD